LNCSIKNNPIILILIIVIIFMVAGGFTLFMDRDNIDRYHEEGEWPGPWHMMGTGGFWMFPFFPIILLAVVLYFVFGKNNARWTGSGSDDSPIELLKRRYAKGEITKEEFDEIKKDL